MEWLRRDFLQVLGGAAASTMALRAAQEGKAPGNKVDDKYDLLITDGRVIDPAQKIDQVLDVGIAYGKIVKVGPNLPRGQAQVFTAAGKLVTPGLIDIHGHVYDEGIRTSIDPDLVGIPKGVTTIVDAGSSGAFTFPGFRKYVIDRARTRVCALLNISAIGLVVNNELYIEAKLLDPKEAIKTIQANHDVIVGIKVRIRGNDSELDHDVDALKKGREAADETGVPIMLHWTNQPRLLSLLKKGDILVHPFNPPQGGPNLLGPDGKVYPQILELKDRGIFTDFAHGGHLQWEVAERATQQGWFPDTISTDIHRRHVGPNGMVQDLVTTIAKFLYLGLPIDQAITKVTANPAKIFRFPEKIGSLEPGSVADVSVLATEQGNYELLDSTRQKRVAHQRIVPVATVRAGKLYRVSA